MPAHSALNNEYLISTQSQSEEYMWSVFSRPTRHVADLVCIHACLELTESIQLLRGLKGNKRHHERDLAQLSVKSHVALKIHSVPVAVHTNRLDWFVTLCKAKCQHQTRLMHSLTIH